MTFCHKSLIGILFVYIRMSPYYCSSKGIELSNPSKLNKKYLTKKKNKKSEEKMAKIASIKINSLRIVDADSRFWTCYPSLILKR